MLKAKNLLVRIKFQTIYLRLQLLSFLDHSQKLLLSKLSRYEVNDIELKWFESCLSNQRQCFYLNRARGE